MDHPASTPPPPASSGHGALAQPRTGQRSGRKRTNHEVAREMSERRVKVKALAEAAAAAGTSGEVFKEQAYRSLGDKISLKTQGDVTRMGRELDAERGAKEPRADVPTVGQGPQLGAARAGAGGPAAGCCARTPNRCPTR